MRLRTRKSIMLSLPLLIGGLMALDALSGCSSPSRVSSTAPTVSYNVTGSNLTQANARAEDYCEHFDSRSRLLSVRSGVATYSCGGTSTAAVPSTTTPTYAAPTYTAPTYTSPTVTSPTVQ